MVDNISTVINEYEERLRKMQVVPLFSHERRMLRSDGAPNRAFFFALFKDHAMAIEFLKEQARGRTTSHAIPVSRR
jgi:hypothetical protein